MEHISGKGNHTRKTFCRVGEGGDERTGMTRLQGKSSTIFSDDEWIPPEGCSRTFILFLA